MKNRALCLRVLESGNLRLRDAHLRRAFALQNFMVENRTERWAPEAWGRKPKPASYQEPATLITNPLL